MTLSIIIPVYNAEKYIGRCINSIYFDSFRDPSDFEVIAIDDGSTDTTHTILQNLSGKYPNLRVFTKKNEGPGKARNYGLNRAQGEYISFVDADDTVVGDQFFGAVEMAKHGEADLYVIGYNVISVPSNDQKLRVQYNPSLITPAELINTSGYQSYTWTFIYKRALITENDLHFQDMRFMEDELFVMTYLMYCNRVKLTDKVAYDYYIHEGSLSNLNHDDKKISAINDAGKVIKELLAIKKSLESSNPSLASAISHRITYQETINVWRTFTLKDAGLRKRALRALAKQELYPNILQGPYKTKVKLFNYLISRKLVRLILSL